LREALYGVGGAILRIASSKGFLVCLSEFWGTIAGFEAIYEGVKMHMKVHI